MEHCPPISDFNPFKKGFNESRYQTFAELLKRDSLGHLLSCHGREWIATRHDHALAILTDKSFVVDDLPERVLLSAPSADQAATVKSLSRALATWFFFVDGPRHAELRKLVGVCFTKTAIESLRSDTKAIIRNVLDSTIEANFNAITSLASVIPARVGMLLLGIPGEHLGNVAALSSDLFGIFTQPAPLRRYQQINDTLERLAGLVSSHLHTQSLGTTTPLMQALMQAQAQGVVSLQELVSLVCMLLSVGQDTTQNLIGNTIYCLANHSISLQRIADGTVLPIDVVRESARLETPVQLVLRRARESVCIAGSEIRAGERVHVFLGAALRDPLSFTDPSSFEPGRTASSVLAFGAGGHFCLGFHLALLQAELVIDSLAECFSDLTFAEPKPRWFNSVHMRGLESLHLSATRRGP